MALHPKIADEDYSGPKASWKKGDRIGQWAVLKKCLTPKWKPNIRVITVDSYWVHPVDAETDHLIRQYFEEHPAFCQKFENASQLPDPYITNCWLDLHEETEESLLAALSELPEQFTTAQIGETVRRCGCQICSNTKPTHLLNLMCYPWQLDSNADTLYHKWDLQKLET